MLFWAMVVVVIRTRRRPFESLRAHESLAGHIVCDLFIGGWPKASSRSMV
jgi:hypothetical protein